MHFLVKVDQPDEAIGCLVLQLKRNRDILRTLFRLATALFVATLLFCISPFVTGLLSTVQATALLVVLMMAIGFVWAGIGAALLGVVRKASVYYSEEFI